MNLYDLKRFFTKPKQDRLIVPKHTGYKVMITTCVHRFLDPDTAFNIIQMLICPSPHFFWSNRKGDALIDRSRSIEASRFLNTELDVLLFIDDDIVFKPEDAIKVTKLAMEKESIVGGAYVNKTEGENHITAKIFNNQEVIFSSDSTPVEVLTVATGFMAIHRKVLEELCKDIPYCHPNTIPFYPFFQPFPREIEGIGWCYLSEDWAFCVRARDKGFKVWLDPSIRLGHAGRKIYDIDDLCRPKKEHKEIIRYKEPEVKNQLISPN